MIPNHQIKKQSPTNSEHRIPFQEEDMKVKAPAKARCCFFGCQEDAVIRDMCQWHHKYEYYESK